MHIETKNAFWSQIKKQMETANQTNIALKLYFFTYEGFHRSKTETRPLNKPNDEVRNPLDAVHCNQDTANKTLQSDTFIEKSDI